MKNVVYKSTMCICLPINIQLYSSRHEIIVKRRYYYETKLTQITFVIVDNPSPFVLSPFHHP